MLGNGRATKLRRIAHSLIEFSGKLLVGGLGLALLFALLAGVQDQRTVSLQSIRVGLNATLMLMMQMEPPRTVLRNPSVGMVVYGWFICTLGWLIVPLLVGVLVDVTIEAQESESALRIRLYRYLQAAGVPPEKLDAAVQEVITRMNSVARKE